MKVATTFLVFALIGGAGQVARGHGDEDHSQAGPKPTQRDQLRIAV